MWTKRVRRLGKCVGAPVWVAALWWAGCGVRSPGAVAYPELTEFAGREVVRVVVAGAEPFPGDTLAGLLETEPTHCNLMGFPICIPGTRIGLQERRLSLDRLNRDVNRLALFYHRSGFFRTRVDPAVRRLNEDRVGVWFVVVRGPEILVDTVVVEGVEGILDEEWLVRRLPLGSGDRFHQGQLAAAADTVLRGLRARGHAYAEVLRSFEVDVATRLATATITAQPGPEVVVDSIIVEGAEHLGRRAALRQLELQEGDLLLVDRLVESQRNLYSLELVQFATVEIAPDELQLLPEDRSRATLLVSVSEAPVHEVDALVGFGTVECFRARVRWVSRSFQGGARRLALAGSVSKIGIAGPLDFGLGGICGAFRDDPFRDDLDFRLSADLTQPWFLNPRNHLTLSAWAERESVPAVFQRESLGARISLNRRFARRRVLTGSLHGEYGRTIAEAAIFCFAFQVCDPAILEQLAERRFRNTLGASFVRDRTDHPLDPRAGQLDRVALAWSPAWLGSDVTFVRGTGELAVYRRPGEESVLAGYVRAGTFFGTATVDAEADEFLPPEERFFAGGPNSVRGFPRNGLGPGVYVAEEALVDPETGTVLVDEDRIRFFPIGGTAVITASGEVRFPSPVLRDVLRAALFVDVGAVGTAGLFDLSREAWAVTPGLGVRFGTAIGPVRLDAAYNPRSPQVGPLFVPDPETDALIRVADRFRPERPGFFGRFQLHLAVGQAF